MRTALKFAVLTCAKVLGLFAVARWFTRRDLRILAYHGAALDDESQFSPGLFISESRFAERMQLLADHGYCVLDLDSALDALDRGKLAPGSTVITIDDGWYGTVKLMAPILKRHDFPATFYVSTYYVEKQTQVFNVAVRYALWKAAESAAAERAMRLRDVDGTFDLKDALQRRAAENAIVAHGDSLADAGARQDLLRRICEDLGIDWATIRERRMFAFACGDELRSLPAKGIDVQLHTHRHRLPVDDLGAAAAEIKANRQSLAAYLNDAFEHITYPDGVFDPMQFPCLVAHGVRSAMTTEGGFVRTTSNRFALPRILDSESVTLLEFEAEMSGLLELRRRLRSVGRVKRLPSRERSAIATDA